MASTTPSNVEELSRLKLYIDDAENQMAGAFLVLRYCSSNDPNCNKETDLNCNKETCVYGYGKRVNGPETQLCTACDTGLKAGIDSMVSRLVVLEQFQFVQEDEDFALACQTQMRPEAVKTKLQEVSSHAHAGQTLQLAYLSSLVRTNHLAGELSAGGD